MFILQKFWILGGLFYLTLVLSLTVYFLGNAQIKKILPGVLIAAAAILSVYFSTVQFLKIQYNPQTFFQPVEAKVDQTSMGQYSFALRLREYLPENSQGCIFFVNDLAGYYMRKELYPRSFGLVETAGKSCNYVVAQFAPLKLQGFEPVLTYKNNYLYKIKR